MRTQIRLLPVLVVIALLAGCATTPADRIEREPAVFARLPVEMQERVRAGQVEIGDPVEAVRLALGEPVQRLNRRTAEGEAEVWVYGRRVGEPRWRFSVGVGGGAGHTAMGAGVGISTGDAGTLPDEAMRVEFVGGRVTRIETRRE